MDSTEVVNRILELTHRPEYLGRSFEELNKDRVFHQECIKILREYKDSIKEGE